MKKFIISFLSVLVILHPAVVIASNFTPSDSQSCEIQYLNSMDGSYELLYKSGSGCVRWETRCKPNVFFPEQTDCEQECVEYSYDSSSSSSSSSSYSSGSYASSGDPFFDLMLYGLLAVVVLGAMWWALGYM